MRSFFIWLGSLDLIEGISLFGSVAFILFIMPFFPLLKNILKVIFSSEKAEIKSFNYSISNDHFLTKIDGKEYYLHPTKPGFVLNGGKIILNWKVTGAYRVDLIPIQKKIKGNSAQVIVSKDTTIFQLTAFTLRGRLRAELKLPIEDIKSIKTINISNQNKTLHRSNSKIKTFQFSKVPTKKWIFLSTIFKKLSLKKIFLLTEFEYFGFKKYQNRNKLNNYIFNAGKLNLKGYRPSRFNKITNENFFNKK